MRIVGGKLGGRRFSGPSGDKTRPTSDRVREAIASALASRGAIDDAHVLELYAGTGAFSFEMLSRGASSAVCVESDARMAKALSHNAAELSLADQVRVLRLQLSASPSHAVTDAIRKARPDAATLVFADPPYAIASQAIPLIDALQKASLIARDALVVLEHASRDEVDQQNLALVARYRYGDTAVSLLTFAEVDI